MTRLRRWIPLLLAVMLLLAAALVISGALSERSGGGPTGTSEQSESTGEGHDEGQEAPETAAAESPITQLVESPISLAGLGLASLALAGLVCLRPTRTVAVAVIAFSVLAGAFDVLELGGNPASYGLVAVILLLRLLTVAGAVTLLRPAAAASNN